MDGSIAGDFRAGHARFPADEREPPVAVANGRFDRPNGDREVCRRKTGGRLPAGADRDGGRLSAPADDRRVGRNDISSHAAAGIGGYVQDPPRRNQSPHGARHMKNRILAAAVALAACGTASADEWKWSVTPYLWATDVGIDVTVRDQQLVDKTIPFEDLLEDLKTGTLFRADAMHGEHGIALDLFNVVIADDSGRVPLPGGSGAELSLDAEVGMTIFDLTGVYDPQGDGKGLSFQYGTRIINQREDIAADLTGGNVAGRSAKYDASNTYVDALFGARYAGNLPGRWSYEIAADLSTGGTDLTWSVSPSIGYTFGKQQQYRMTAGYRRMVVDFDTQPTVDLDMTLSGYLIGFRFAF
jgi:hypothetical protein